jgi:hypothetical protein
MGAWDSDGGASWARPRQKHPGEPYKINCGAVTRVQQHRGAPGQSCSTKRDFKARGEKTEGDEGDIRMQNADSPSSQVVAASQRRHPSWVLVQVEGRSVRRPNL